MAENVEEVIIPDQALDYITAHYLERLSVEGVPVVIGISTKTVEDVLGLFVDWAAKNGYVRNGVLTIGGHKIL